MDRRILDCASSDKAIENWACSMLSGVSKSSTASFSWFLFASARRAPLLGSFPLQSPQVINAVSLITDERRYFPALV
jgi:hypothetical protein